MKTLTSKLTLIATKCREVIALADESTRAPFTVEKRRSRMIVIGGNGAYVAAFDYGVGKPEMVANSKLWATSRTLTPALAWGILAVIEFWLPLIGSALAKSTLQAIADSFTGEGWE